MTDGLLSETSMSWMRPPMLAGPMLRNRNCLSNGSDDWLIIGVGGGVAPPPPCAASGVTAGVNSSDANERKRDERMDIDRVLVVMLAGKQFTTCDDIGRFDYPARSYVGQAYERSCVSLN